MKLVEVKDLEKLSRSRRDNGKNIELVKEFFDSGLEVAELKGWEECYKNTGSAVSVIIRSIALAGLKEKVGTKTIKYRIFLYRKDLLTVT